MAEPEAGAPAGEGGAGRFLTFRLAERLYALPAAEVAEVIRVPPVARMPQAPASLLGLANHRGDILPVASLRGLLGEASIAPSGAARAVVLTGDQPVALAVDAVDGLASVAADEVEMSQSALSVRPGERLLGAFRSAGAQDVARILDLRGMLAGALVARTRVARAQRAGFATVGGGIAGAAATDQEKIVTFEAGGQEFALPLEAVREIVPAPDRLARAPLSETLVLGIVPHRDTLLPLFSVAGLLGLDPTAEVVARKVVVTTVAGVLVGLVADRMRAILPLDPRLVEPTPAALAARAGGESRIKAIYRAEGGARLISILSPELLFGEDVMARLDHTAGRSAAAEESGGTGVQDERELTFLVFRLGEDEFALPIEVVDEVAQVPGKISRLPRTPAFLEGVINLRGEVLPVIDQRRRFDMPPLEAAAGRRLVVVRTQRHRAGLIVDSVSQVLRASAEAMDQAPDLVGEATRLVQGVINLEEAGRLVLVLDPAELLSRAERALLDSFEARAAQADL
jgi:purine-binding chemotaxis protein CheW